MVSSGPYADLVGSVRDRLPAVLHYHISHEALNGTRLENYTIHRLTRHVDSARLRADKTEAVEFSTLRLSETLMEAANPTDASESCNPMGHISIVELTVIHARRSVMQIHNNSSILGQ